MWSSPPLEGDSACQEPLQLRGEGGVAANHQLERIFGHQENVQVALLASSNVANRILAIETILKIRKESDNRNPDGSVRVFKVPKLNFLADHISELCVFEDSATEAPLS